MDVMQELDEIDPLFDSGNYQEGFQKLWELWDRIPKPKTETLNAYWTIETGVLFALRSGDLDEAQKCADLAPPFKANRHDVGEVEFLIGKVALARGDLDRARENFTIANKRSEERAFEGEDPKYLKLLE